MGKKEELFVSIEKMGSRIAEAGLVFEALVQNLEQAKLHADRMHEIEHAADSVLKYIFEKVLPAMSQLPFGLEHNEVSIIIRGGDSIIDALWQASNKIGRIYQLADKDPELEEAAQLLVEATKGIRDLFTNFKRFDRQRNMPQVRESLHRIESRADELKDAVVARRYAQAHKDPRCVLLFIAWKEVYDSLEIATDICEDIIDLFCDFHQKYS